MGYKSDAEAMSELASLMWSRYFKEQVRGELNHEMNAFKAEVVTNHGDGTLTIQRPFESVQLRLKAAPSLAYSQAGDMVLVVGIGDKSKALSNAFILCKTDLSDGTSIPTYGLGKNLLRNSYFAGLGTGRGVLPVNQRGLSSYTSGTEYTVDGWKKRNTWTVALASDGLHCTFPSSSTSLKGLNQAIGINKSELVGKTVTCSVLIKNWSMTTNEAYPRFGLYSGDSVHVHTSAVLAKQITGNGLWTVTGVVPSSVNNYTFLNFSTLYAGSQNGTCTIVAAKLELGSHSTLAHLENGAWVLNEAPDYEAELLRCQTSAVDPEDTYANFTVATGEMLGPVETGSTASRAYGTNDYFVWKGNFYKATNAISSGATISPGTGSSNNCVQTTVAAELIALR